MGRISWRPGAGAKRTRRTAASLAVSALALLWLAAIAAATPEVHFKAQFVPIAGFAKTGNIFGAGAAVQAEYTIGGTEYFGSPPPIIGINTYLPSKTKVHSKGFATCSAQTLREQGTSACPSGSAAGPAGTAGVLVTLGGERIPESIEALTFNAPGGGINLFFAGHSPVSVEAAAAGDFGSLNGAGGYGAELQNTVGLITSIPGAPFVSFESIKARFGAAYNNSKGKATYYFKVPSKCTGSFAVKTEVTFAEDGEEFKPETVTATYAAPCPKK